MGMPASMCDGAEHRCGGEHDGICPLSVFQRKKKQNKKQAPDTCNPPFFWALWQRDSPQYQALSVPEHSQPGTVVGNVTGAVDADEGSNAIVYYFIAGGCRAAGGRTALCPHVHTLPRVSITPIISSVPFCPCQWARWCFRKGIYWGPLSVPSWEPGEQLPAEPGGEAAGLARPGPGEGAVLLHHR